MSPRARGSRRRRASRSVAHPASSSPRISASTSTPSPGFGTARRCSRRRSSQPGTTLSGCVATPSARAATSAADARAVNQSAAAAITGDPLLGEGRLPVPGRGDQHPHLGRRVVEQGEEPRALDDPTRPERTGGPDGSRGLHLHSLSIRGAPTLTPAKRRCPRRPEPPRALGQRRRRGARLQVSPDGQRILAREQPEGDRDLAPTRHTELLAEDVAVRLGGPGGDPEPCSNLVVRAPGCDQGDDLPLTRGNRRRFPLRGQLDHGREAIPPFEGRPFLTGCICGCIRCALPASRPANGTLRDVAQDPRSRPPVRAGGRARLRRRDRGGGGARRAWPSSSDAATRRRRRDARRRSSTSPASRRTARSSAPGSAASRSSSTPISSAPRAAYADGVLPDRRRRVRAPGPRQARSSAASRSSETTR